MPGSEVGRDINLEAPQASEIRRRVALETFRVGQQDHARAKAALGEQARHDQSVAAVIAAPCDNEDEVGLERRESLRYEVNDRAACALHQGQARDA